MYIKRHNYLVFNLIKILLSIFCREKIKPYFCGCMINENFDIERIEQVICDFFKVSSESLYQRQGTHREATARHFLWYILHTDFGMSNSKIAKRYIRSERATLRYRSEVKFRVANVGGDRRAYEKIKELLCN